MRHVLVIRVICGLFILLGATPVSLAEAVDDGAPATQIATEVPPPPAVETQPPVVETQPPVVETATATQLPTETATATVTATATDTATVTATEMPNAAARNGVATDTPVPNTDTLVAVSPVEATLAPGAQQAFTATYTVTTSRTGTRIRAELRFADGSPANGWSLSTQAGAGAWADGGASVDVMEEGTLAPGGAFTLSLVVTAPSEVAAKHTVSLFVSSIASTGHGDETGVAPGGPVASLTVVPPPPTPNSLTCDVPAATTEIAPGETAELPCDYIVNDPAARASVTASFGAAPAEGWMLAISDGPAGETARWAPAEPLAAGATVALVVVVTAPADAEAGRQVTVTVAGDGINPAVAWPLTVAAPDDIDDDGFSIMSVDPAGGICTQTQPDGNVLPPGTAAVFRCGRGGLTWTDLDVIRISAPSAGWHYSVNSGPPRDFGYYTESPLDLLPEETSTFSIGLVRNADTIDESVGSVTVEYFRRSCGFGGTNCSEVLMRSATLSITWPTPDVTCDLIGPAGALVGPGEYATFKCTHSNPGFRLLRTSADSRWELSSSTGSAPINPSSWSSGSTWTYGTSQAVFLYIRPFQFYPPNPGTVKDFQVVFQQDLSNIETQKTLTVTYDAVFCAPAVSLAGGGSFGTSTWDGDGYAPVNAIFGLSFLRGGGPDCGGFTNDWSVQLSSDGLTDGGDGHIVPSDISYVVSDAPAGLTEVATNQPLAATGTGTTKIADGSANVLPKSMWVFTLRLQPPSDAPPGDYTGTITVTIASGD